MKKRLFAIILVLALLMNTMVFTVSADTARPGIKAVLNNDTITAGEAHDIVLTVSADPGFSACSAFEFQLDLPEGFSIKSFEPGNTNCKANDFDNNTKENIIRWANDGIDYALTDLALVTLTVADTVKAGKYDIIVKNAVAAYDGGWEDIWESGNTDITDTVTLNVIREGAPVLKAELDTTSVRPLPEAQDVVMTVYADPGLEAVSGFNFTVVLPEGFTFKSTERGTTAFDEEDMLDDFSTGVFGWANSTGNNVSATVLEKITITVPADVAVGMYDIVIKEIAASYDYSTADIWEEADGTTFTVPLAVTRATGNIVAELDKTSIKPSDEPQDIVLTVSADPAFEEVSSFEFNIDLPNGFTIKSAAPASDKFSEDDFTNNLEKNFIGWAGARGMNVSTSVLQYVTITVPAGAAEGSYRITVNKAVATKDFCTVDLWDLSDGISDTVTLTIAGDPAPEIKAELNTAKITADGSAQDIVLTVSADPGFDACSAFEFQLDLPEGFSIKSFEPGNENCKANDFDNNTKENIIRWANDGDDYALTDLALVTITVADTVKPGTYDITVKNAVAAYDGGWEDIWESGNTDITDTVTLEVEAVPAPEIKAELDKSSLTIAGVDQEVVLTVSADPGFSAVGAYEFTVDLPEGFTIKEAAPAIGDFKPGDHYNDLSKGLIRWADRGGNEYAASALETITITVPAGTEAGEYTITVKNAVASNDLGEIWASGNEDVTDSVKLTIGKVPVPKVKATLDKKWLTADGTAQQVVLTVSADPGFDAVSAFQFVVDLPEGFTMIDTAPANENFAEDDWYDNFDAGLIGWADNEGTEYAVTELATATIAVPASVQPGDYTFTVKECVASKENNLVEIWETLNTDVTATAKLKIGEIGDSPIPDIKAKFDEDTVVLGGEERQVLLTVSAKPKFDELNAFEFMIDMPEGFSIKSVAPATSAFDPDDFVNNLEENFIGWANSEGDNVAADKLVYVTITVPADMPSGEYTFTVNNAVASKNGSTYEIWESLNTDVTATAVLTVDNSVEEPAPDLVATLNKDTVVTGGEDQTLLLTVSADPGFEALSAFQFLVALPDGVTITDVAGGNGRIKDNDMVLNDEIGLVGWAIPDGVDISATALAQLTLSVPGDMAEGTYDITVYEAIASKDLSLTEIWRTGNTKYTDTVSFTVTKKTTQTITANDVNITFGDVGRGIFASTSGNGKITFAADDSGIIAVDKDTGELTTLAVGDAVVIVTAEETSYYKKAVKTVRVTVKKALPDYTVPTGLTANANDTLGSVELPEGFYWQDPRTTTVGGVGQHQFKVTYVPEDENYATVEDIIVTITVLNKPEQTVTASDITVTYGDTGRGVFGRTSGDGKISYAVKSGNAVSINAATGELTVLKAGTAIVTVTASETDIYGQASKDITVTVEQKEVILDWITTVFTYDGEEKVPDVTVRNAVSGDQVNVEVAGAAIDAGTYTATAAGLDNANYKLPETAQTCTFKINKVTTQWTDPDEDITAVYGDTLADVELPEGYRWKDDPTTSVGNATETGNVFPVIYCPDEDNYTETEGTVVIYVGKADAPFTAPDDLTAVAGDTLAEVEGLPEGFSWQDDPETTRCSLGDNIFKVTFTPEDTANYKTVTDIHVHVMAVPKVLNYTKCSGVYLADYEFEDGYDTFVVSCAEACMVAAQTGEDEYVRLKAVKRADGVYTFDLSDLTTDFTLVIAIRGDANMDGYINSTDLGQARGLMAQKLEVDKLKMMVMDLQVDNMYNSTDLGQLRARMSGKLVLPW